MFKRKCRLIILFIFVSSALPCVSFAWQGTSQVEVKGTQIQNSHYLNSKKKSKKREKSDFWANTQNMRYKLFKEDLADTSRYSNPLITEIPTLKSESIPCSLRPSSGAGFKTNCKF